MSRLEWSEGRYGVFTATTPLYTLELRVEYRGERGGFVATVGGWPGLRHRDDEVFSNPEAAKVAAERLAVKVLRAELEKLVLEEE